MSGILNGASCGAVMTAKGEGKPGRCGAEYIFGCQKFSASLVNGQNDYSRHIICLDYFLYSSYSRNCFSPKNITYILFPHFIRILSPKVASYLTNEIQGEIKNEGYELKSYRFLGVLLLGSSLFKKLTGRGGHHRVIHCASGMAIYLHHKAASENAPKMPQTGRLIGWPINQSTSSCEFNEKLTIKE